MDESSKDPSHTGRATASNLLSSHTLSLHQTVTCTHQSLSHSTLSTYTAKAPNSHQHTPVTQPLHTVHIHCQGAKHTVTDISSPSYTSLTHSLTHLSPSPPSPTHLPPTTSLAHLPRTPSLSHLPPMHSSVRDIPQKKDKGRDVQ